MMKLADMPGLEPGALRCAGSSPVLGIFVNLLVGNSLIGRASDSESEG